MIKLWKGHEKIDDVPQEVVRQIIAELLHGKFVDSCLSELDFGIKTKLDGYLIAGKWETIQGTVSRWQGMVKEGFIYPNMDFKPEDGLMDYVKPDGTWTKEDRKKAWDKYFEERGKKNWVHELEELEPWGNK